MLMLNEKIDIRPNKRIQCDLSPNRRTRCDNVNAPSVSMRRNGAFSSSSPSPCRPCAACRCSRMAPGYAQGVAHSGSSGPSLLLAAAARPFLVRWLAALQAGLVAWVSSPQAEGLASAALASRIDVWVSIAALAEVAHLAQEQLRLHHVRGYKENIAGGLL
jgi:hypothetical protein